MEKEGNVHAGHRQRLKRQFLEAGLDSLSDVNCLELLLFYAIARRDTNPLAHALLEQFGSLSAVFNASPEQLQQVPGKMCIRDRVRGKIYVQFCREFPIIA